MSEPATEIQEAELVEPGAELVPVENPAPITLFGTSDPRVALERMSEVATALVDVIEAKNLYATISGRRHITCEGWTTLGGMLGIVPVVVETRANEDHDGIVARVEARTLDGRVVGAAEGECSRAESKWKHRDPFAIRSMAQTRAISRALRAPLGQIVVLAGYQPAAAEEMPADSAGPEESKPGTAGHAEPASSDQRDEIAALLRSLKEIDPDEDWKTVARGIAGGSPGAELKRGQAETVIERLRERLKAAAG
jgi:hypothetical protein